MRDADGSKLVNLKTVMTAQQRRPQSQELNEHTRRYETLFVVGCPRSGTTWVQLLLAQNPAVATAPETQIFAYYLDRFRRQWRHEHDGPGRRTQGKAGLSRLFSEEEFEQLCRLNAEFVLEKIARASPRPRLVMEKSPRHALHVEWIHRLFPEAYFLHVVRDPRDTVSSILAAARTWGRWAPRNPIDGARMWRAHVEGARRGSSLTRRYREISFESLRSNAAGELARILQWLGLESDRAACHSAVEACELANLREREEAGQLPLPGTLSPRGFFGNGAVGGWQKELSRSQFRIIERICGGLMEELGYPRLSHGRNLGSRFRIRLHDAIQRVRESVDWQLERLVRRV